MDSDFTFGKQMKLTSDYKLKTNTKTYVNKYMTSNNRSRNEAAF